MKAIAPIENTETTQEPSKNLPWSIFVVFALLFGGWLVMQLVK